MKNLYSIFCTLSIVLASVTSGIGQDSTKYIVEIDIKNIQNDQVRVNVFPPNLSGESAIYNIPKIVPGTYSVSDFGRFIEGFEAFNVSGDILASKKLDDNRWEVENATEIHKISYLVNDTYDEPEGGGIFEPAGTNIEAGKNVVLNPYGFAGYFDGTKSHPIEVQVIKPKDFYGESSLKKTNSTDDLDTYYARNYFEYHDCPMLYAVPDTASVMVAGARIAIATYAPYGTIKSKDIMEVVADIFPAAARYLGGSLPVDQYSILVYLTDGASASGGFGALEHNTSTVFVLPEAPMSALEQTFKDVTAHEFFHIVTPLNIHSEEIDDYDFMNPQMSAHLWLYEGCTEYAAQHVQVKEGDMTFEQFLEVMRDKMVNASQFDSGIAFTEMSKKALGEHADQYGNVYEQGALIGMALDLKLRTLSDGAYGTQELMRDLAAEYGMDKPFKDDELFSEIARVSGYPEIESFLNTYVGGSAPLPFTELLAEVGIQYQDVLVENAVSGGNLSIGYNQETQKLVVVDVSGLDEFGQNMGFQKDDQLVSWNGTDISIDNLRDVLDDYRQNVNEGDKVQVEVERLNKKGKAKIKTLKAKAIYTERTTRNIMQEMEPLTEQQAKLRKAWVNK